MKERETEFLGSKSSITEIKNLSGGGEAAAYLNKHNKELLNLKIDQLREIEKRKN